MVRGVVGPKFGGVGCGGSDGWWCGPWWVRRLVVWAMVGPTVDGVGCCV